ncbi:MAG: Gfo/Idh/MocA family oxidoreductase [Clostridia bacterium]|nr:Gfo/Idh/MocA family oxidoreductase [Clostridia bacterium]
MLIKREKRNTVRVGYIGLGRRGFGMLKHNLAKMRDVEVDWICDLDEKKLKEAVEMLAELGRETPKTTTNYKDILADEAVDAVIVMTGWDYHIECALESLKAGKYTAMEVGCAYDISECHALVDAYEEHGAPLMMLENCCYGRRELMALRMVREGLFGEVVHAAGGYHHYLNECELFGNVHEEKFDSKHYRQYEYFNRNCENYPTHEFGPISKILRINRGNRLLTLSSFASKARGLRDFTSRHLPDGYPGKGGDFKQGDIVTTVLTCAGGETVTLTLDTTTPRPYYSRGFTVRGTRGCCIEEGNGQSTFFLEGMKEGIMGNEKEFFDKYDHPLQAENSKAEQTEGHADGIDWLVLRAFIEAVKAGTDTPIDAYDTATWLAIGPLSEASIARGGAAVDVPDFTRGRWFRREPVIECKYCLDEICTDESTPIVPK